MTPSPRILAMLGEIPFKPWQCIAELVDNSIDALLTALETNPNWVEDELGGMEMYPISIDLPNEVDLTSGRGKITVQDLGPGMTLGQLRKSVKAGFSGNDPVSKLGLFGMGFNIATAKLGKVTTVRTSRKEDPKWTCIKIDFDEMIKVGRFSAPAWREDKGSDNPEEEHGTIVEISNLKREMCRPISSGPGKGHIRKNLGKIYANIIDKYGVHIRIGDNLDVIPRRHCVWSDSRSVTTGSGRIPAIIEIDETLPSQDFCRTCWGWAPANSSEDGECINCGLSGGLIERKRRVHGWIGIQRFFHAEDFGIDLIRNGRVIERGSKDLFFWENDAGVTPLDYPIDTTHWGGRIVGEIHLDFIGVSYTKNSFNKDFTNWDDAVEVIRGVGPLRPKIGEEHGYGVNESPLARLFTGFRKGNPPGKRNLVPGDPTDPARGDNSTPRAWAQHFWDGLPDYQDDSKWWALVEAAETARRQTSGGTIIVGGDDPTDPFGEVDDEEEEGDEYEGVLNVGLSGMYEIRPASLNGISVTAYEDTRRRTIRELSKESPVKAVYINAGDARLTYHLSHPALSSYSEDVKDYILMELASQFSIRAGLGSEWSVTRCYSYLKEKYKEDSKLDIQTLGPAANSILGELKEHLSTLELSTTRDKVPEADLEMLETRVLREITGGPDVVDGLLSSGEYIRYMPNHYIVQYFKIEPSLSMDGKFFEVPYEGLTPNGKEEAVAMITSSLRDAIDAVERAQSTQSPGKLWLMRASASIAFLDSKRAL